LGEHLLCKQGVVGSIPSSSTNVPARDSFARAFLSIVASKQRSTLGFVPEPSVESCIVL
jgi:hypothetical protein